MNLLIIPTTHPDIYVRVLSFGRNYVLTDGRSTDIIEVKKEGMNMTMQSMLREKNISIYRLSQIRVPKTTVIDICSGTYRKVAV